MEIRRLVVKGSFLARVGAVVLAATLVPAFPAGALDRWFEPGCFNEVDNPNVDAALTAADEACRAASNEAYASEALRESELARVCEDAEDMWVRSEWAMALVAHGAWDEASTVLENAIATRAAPFLLNMLNSLHDGDWIAVRAEANASAACMAGVRLESMMRDLDNDKAMLSDVIRMRAIERYRRAAQGGLSFAQARADALSEGAASK